MCAWDRVIDWSPIHGLVVPCAQCSQDSVWIHHNSDPDKVVTQYE